MTRDLLATPEPPWVFLDVLDPELQTLIPDAQYGGISKAPVIRKLRGMKMRTRQGLMDEFGAALQFFDGFGENWYALEECLQTLDEWLPGDSYLLVITDPEQLLDQDDSKELQWFLLTLKEVGEWWAQPVTGEGRFDRPAIPFHVVLQVASHELGSLAPALRELPVLGGE